MMRHNLILGLSLVILVTILHCSSILAVKKKVTSFNSEVTQLESPIAAYNPRFRSSSFARSINFGNQRYDGAAVSGARSMSPRSLLPRSRSRKRSSARSGQRKIKREQTPFFNGFKQDPQANLRLKRDDIEEEGDTTLQCTSTKKSGKFGKKKKSSDISLRSGSQKLTVPGLGTTELETSPSEDSTVSVSGSSSGSSGGLGSGVPSIKIISSPSGGVGSSFSGLPAGKMEIEEAPIEIQADPSVDVSTGLGSSGSSGSPIRLGLNLANKQGGGNIASTSSSTGQLANPDQVKVEEGTSTAGSFSTPSVSGSSNLGLGSNGISLGVSSQPTASGDSGEPASLTAEVEDTPNGEESHFSVGNGASSGAFGGGVDPAVKSRGGLLSVGNIGLPITIGGGGSGGGSGSMGSGSMGSGSMGSSGSGSSGGGSGSSGGGNGSSGGGSSGGGSGSSGGGNGSSGGGNGSSGGGNGSTGGGSSGGSSGGSGSKGGGSSGGASSGGSSSEGEDDKEESGSSGNNSGGASGSSTSSPGSSSTSADGDDEEATSRSKHGGLIRIGDINVPISLKRKIGTDSNTGSDVTENPSGLDVTGGGSSINLGLNKGAGSGISIQGGLAQSGGSSTGSTSQSSTSQPIQELDESDGSSTRASVQSSTSVGSGQTSVSSGSKTESPYTGETSTGTTVGSSSSDVSTGSPTTVLPKLSIKQGNYNSGKKVKMGIKMPALYESPKVADLPTKCRSRLYDMKRALAELVALTENLGQKVLVDKTLSYLTREILLRRLGSVESLAKEARLAASLGNLEEFKENARDAGLEALRIGNLQSTKKLEPSWAHFAQSLRRLFSVFKKACKV